MSEELKKYFFHYRWLAVIIVFVLFNIFIKICHIFF